MAVFAYKGIDVDASNLSGTIIADTPRQARDMLRQRNITISNIAPIKESTSKNWWPFGQKVQSARVVEFTRELSTLLGVGIPLLDAIDTLVSQHRGKFKTCLQSLRERIASGSSLADAMRQQPKVFDEFCISITEVGEDAGTLDTSLEELAEFREKTQQLKGKIATAILYPCIVLVTGLAVSIFLMTYVVPSLLEGLLEAGRPLPWPTKVVKAISDFLLEYPLPLVFGVVGLFVLIGSVLRTQRGQLIWHRFLLRIPILGNMIRKQAIARIAIIISTLMKSGLTFIRGIQISRQATQNRIIKNALEVCENAVGAGQDIAVALEKTQAFPPMVIQIFAVGQHSGQLERMLDRLATDYDRQVNIIATRFTSVLEPILIILLAIIVGFVAFATILPLLEAGNVF